MSLGSRLLDSEQFAEAASYLAQAAERRPDDPAILAKLATAYHRSGKLLPALNAYDRLIGLGAADAATWYATGNALSEVGEYAQAVRAHEASLELTGRNPEANHNLAQALYRLGEVDRAVDHLETSAAQSDLIDPLLALATIIPGSPRATAEKILAVRQAFAARLAECLGVSRASSPAYGRKAAGGPLRVGYISAYFHGANYMKPVWGLVNHHDRAAFEIHLFSDSLPEQGMAGYAGHPNDRVHDTRALNNDELAELIRACDIDVLVDLNGYSAPERLGLFVRRIAPATIAWFNTYATSGLPGLDYIVGDEEVVRRAEGSFFAEEVLRLPLSYLTFEVGHAVPPVAPPPSLKNGWVTFGSLVSQYKITPPVLDAWSEILKRAPSARLVLANAALKSVCNREYVSDQFRRRGVDPGRLTCHGPADHLSFLRNYDQIDVALDAFPYNGGTTTMEAIWQGVPVLTFAGDRWASRTSQSLLRHTHLKEFVAEDAASMVELAVRLAHAPDTAEVLSRVRETTRETLRQSSVCDTRALAEHMEGFYRTVRDASRPRGT